MPPSRSQGLRARLQLMRRTYLITTAEIQNARWIACGLALLIIVASMASAVGARPRRAQFDGTAIQDLSSSIDIVDVFAHHDDRSSYGVASCVEFKNISTKNVTRAAFMIAYLDENDAIVGSIDSLSDSKQVQPGATQEERVPPGFRGGVPATAPNCYWYSSGVVAGIDHLYARHTMGSTPKRIAHMVAWVQSVSFADGTTWKSPSPIPVFGGQFANLSSVASPLQDGLFPGAAFQIPPSGVEIVNVYATGGKSVSDCLAFRNTSTKDIRHVQFFVAHYDENGAVTGSYDPLDAVQTVAVGQTVGRTNLRATNPAICRADDNASLNNNAFLLSSPDPNSRAQTVVAQLVVWPSTVDFSDGTSWRAVP